MSDNIPRDDELRKVARKAGEQLLFRQTTRVIGKGLPIYDILGTLLFVDYIVESDKMALGWVRTMPDGLGTPSGPFVSAELGRHPSASTGGPSEIFARFAKSQWKLTTQSMRREYFKRPFVFCDELDSKRKEVEERPRIVCYHYPALGVEIQTAKGTLAYVDVSDGKRVVAESESGGTLVQQSRKPYSLLLLQGELGPPGEFSVPQDEFALNHCPQIGQEKDNWCAAAACQMILKFHGYNVPQERIASLMQIPADPQQGGAPDLTIQTNAYIEASTRLLNARHDVTPTGAECIRELWEFKRPLKNAITGHAQTIAGWRDSEYGPQYLIRDPMPVGSGSIKYQNPAVICSRNFVLADATPRNVQDLINLAQDHVMSDTGQKQVAAIARAISRNDE